MRDLAEIADYIRERNPAAARGVRVAILRSLQTLSSFPKAGRQQNERGVRKYVTQPYAYVVYYDLDEPRGEVRVITVRHPARRPGL